MKTLIRSIVLSASLFFALPGFGQRIGFGLHIQVGPPVPRHEVIIEQPYPEAIWVPGYYIYDPGVEDYVWVTGRWRHPPYHGARWVAPEWRHERGEYHFHHGRWK